MMSQLDPTITVWAGLALPPLLTLACAAVGAWREGVTLGTTGQRDYARSNRHLTLRSA